MIGAVYIKQLFAQQIAAARQRQIEFLKMPVTRRQFQSIPNFIAIDPVWSPAQGCKRS